MDTFSLHELLSILLFLLILGAWFSAAETSMMALSRHRLSHLVRKGSRSAKLTARLLSKIDALLGSILFGNTLLNVASAAITNIIILRLFGYSEWALLSGTLLITFILLIFSEIMPKVIAASHPERVALPSSYLLAPLITLFHPVVSVATSTVRAILWALRIKIQTDQSKNKMGLEELRGLVLDAEHYMPRKQQKMLLNLVDVEKVSVNDVMIPRNQIEALDISAAPEILREQLATCHHTLLPVFDSSLDHILGILHVRRALALLHRESFSREDLLERLTEPYFIPSETRLLSQLQQFQERQSRLGLIVDEYGELLGLVTLENILEEIVGDFTTQTPSHTTRLHAQPDGSVLIEGSVPLRELNRKLGLNLPLDVAKTLNGLILEHLEDIPEAGTSLKITGVPIEIIQTQDHAVKVARIFPPDQADVSP